MNQQDRSELTNGLLEMSENFRPMIEAAEGQRAELERRGWSPSAAEAVALELLLGMVRGVFSGGQR